MMRGVMKDVDVGVKGGSSGAPGRSITRMIGEKTVKLLLGFE